MLNFFQSRPKGRVAKSGQLPPPTFWEMHCYLQFCKRFFKSYPLRLYPIPTSWFNSLVFFGSVPVSLSLFSNYPSQLQVVHTYEDLGLSCFNLFILVNNFFPSYGKEYCPYSYVWSWMARGIVYDFVWSELHFYISWIGFIKLTCIWNGVVDGLNEGESNLVCICCINCILTFSLQK